MRRLNLYVEGTPVGMPRPRGRAIIKKGRKPFAQIYNPKDADPWKDTVAAAVTEAAQVEGIPTPVDDPVEASLHFILPRPKDHFRTGRYAHLLREDAPMAVTTKPDRDNLDKAVLDGITRAGFWKDDAQAWNGRIVKTYADPGESPGVEITLLW